ncbi:MAG: hypothetical protein WBP61_19865, partial [Nocardioides sp.]
MPLRTPLRRVRRCLPARALISCVVAIAAAPLAVPTAQAAAEHSAADSVQRACPAGTVVWVVQDRRRCLPAPSALPSDELLSSSTAQWLKSVSTRRSGSRWKPPAALRRSTPRAARSAERVSERAADRIATYVDEHPPSPREPAGRSSGPAVLFTETVTGPTVTSPDGATVTATATARVYEDYSRDIDVTVTATIGDLSLRWSPELDMSSKSWRTVGCPTAQGRVTYTERVVIGGTAMILRGRKVVKAVTQRFKLTATSVGKVGRDARLHEVRSSARISIEHFERGMQFEATIDGDFTAERDGDPAITGSPSVTVKAKVAGFTRAEEAVAESTTAREYATNPAVARLAATVTSLSQGTLVSAESGWYDIPNRCAAITFDPMPVATLAHGAQRAVTAEVVAVGGGAVESRFTITSVDRGSLTASRLDGDPGSPALLTATGADHDEDTTTVSADLIATSRVGRAARSWIAESEPISLPEAFDGTLSATTTTAGQHEWSFSGTAHYTRTSLSVSPQGFVSAWYELTDATLDEVTEELGLSGCRWVGRGSGGTIEAGDLEIRRTPDGATTYALMYDVMVADVDFVPTDCPPGVLQPFTGDITAF